MQEIIDDLIKYSTDGVISVKVANDLINRAHAHGFEEGREMTINICKQLIKL